MPVLLVIEQEARIFSKLANDADSVIECSLNITTYYTKRDIFQHKILEWLNTNILA